jgi:hypothetical protein
MAAGSGVRNPACCSKTSSDLNVLHPCDEIASARFLFVTVGGAALVCNGHICSYCAMKGSIARGVDIH